MSFATASCALWQNEQRSISSEPDLVFTRPYSFSGGLAVAGLRLQAEPRQAAALHCFANCRPYIETRSLSRLIDDIVNDSIFLSLLRIHDEVAFHVLLHFIQFLAGVLGQ